MGRKKPFFGEFSAGLFKLVECLWETGIPGREKALWCLTSLESQLMGIFHGAACSCFIDLDIPPCLEKFCLTLEKEKLISRQGEMKDEKQQDMGVSRELQAFLMC